MVVTFSGSLRIEFSSNSFGLDRKIKRKLEVIGKNRHREQVNSKVCSLRFQLLFNPNLAVVEVLSRDGIESKKKAATCHPTDGVQDCNLGRIEQFSACESDHSKYISKRTSSYPALPPTRLPPPSKHQAERSRDTSLLYLKNIGQSSLAY